VKLYELKRVVEAARDAERKAVFRLENVRCEKKEAARKAIEAELAPQIAEVGLLKTAWLEANKAVEDELIRLASDGSRHKYAIGTKLRKFAPSSSRTAQKELVGVLEVVTRDTKFPDNTPGWERPDVGQFIVRLCKQDGTLGKRFETWRDNSSWKPVEMQSEATK